MLRVIRVNSQNLHLKNISVAVDYVKKGNIIVYPTDTVYGLGCNALNLKAVSKIFRVKHRPTSLPLPIAVADLAMAEEYAIVTKEARKLITVFWPGALTIVLKKKKKISDVVSAGRIGIGLRAPNHPVPLFIIRESKLPLVSTSANKHGFKSPITTRGVINQIGEDVDLAIIEDKFENHPTSTVLDLTKKHPLILRKGSITKDSIAKVMERTVFYKGKVNKYK